jgi:transglutaminase-like putative cysteine protease
LRIAIHHTTHYAYDGQVTRGLKRLRLMPKTSHGQQVREWRMTYQGAVAEAEYDDHNNNHTTLVSLVPGAENITVSCEGIVDTADNAGVLGPHTGNMPLWLFGDPTPLTEPGPRVQALASSIGTGPSGGLDMLHRLCALVRETVAYETGRTTVETTAEEALATGAGVCQDHAHIFIAAARLLGVPARYVGGYLLMDGQVEQDAGHAWAEVHVAGLGWVGFDVSNAISPDERYVRVATGRDYREAAPVTGGAIGGGQAGLSVRVAVEQQQTGQ